MLPVKDHFTNTSKRKTKTKKLEIKPKVYQFSTFYYPSPLFAYSKEEYLPDENIIF